MTPPTIEEAAALVRHLADAGEALNMDDVALGKASDFLDRYEHANAAATVPGRPVGQPDYTRSAEGLQGWLEKQKESLREAAGVLALLRGIDGPQGQRLAMELSAIADYVTDTARDLEEDLADADSTMNAEDAAMLARIQEAVLGQRDEQASVNDPDKAAGSPEGKP